MPMNADECRRRHLCQGPCVAARSITRLAPAAPPGELRALSRQSGVLCVVWGTPVASAQTKANRVKAAGPGALGVLLRGGSSFDHITINVSTCSPAYNTPNVALLNPASSYYTSSEDAES